MKPVVSDTFILFGSIKVSTTLTIDVTSTISSVVAIVYCQQYPILIFIANSTVLTLSM